MIRSKLFKHALRLALVVLAATLLPTHAAAQNARAQDSRDHNNWTWTRSDDGKKIEVKVEDKVEFNDDYSDVASIPPGGALRIYDSRTPVVRRLVVTRGDGDELRRDYTVNGERRAFDETARAWLRGVLLDAARQGGLDARNRVQRILRQRGTRGLVEEIAHIEGDYARRIYFDEFLKVDNLSNDDLRAAVRNASRSIASDYERAQLLLHVSEVFLAKDDLLPAYFDALNVIGSDYERHRVLTGTLKRASLSRNALVAIADSASRIGSDYEKASFLIEAASRYQTDERLRAAFQASMRTIGSDYERGRVQTRLAKLEQ
jgi:hypothetical protein